jgi:uncharacterized membrane protein
MATLRRLGQSLRARIRTYFLTGLLVIVPLGLTLYVVSLIASYTDRVLAILPAPLHPDSYLPFRVPGLGVIVTLAIIQLVGFLSANLLGRSVVRAYERILERIPVVRTFYTALKQVLEQLLSGDQARFRRVVLVEYPRQGIYSIGFVTGEAHGEVGRAAGEGSLNAFIPTTPNPTSGFYLVIPERDVIALDMTVEQAFKLIMSAGMLTADLEKQKARSSSVRASGPGRADR